ncbi:unnamed protein product [Phytophthora fragariaefolia]|uniref:Unnamed protein product n=1 Tax=Phytophthora fragariaefolia TaxID=1490495 RepID=A0A9W6XKQ0_9STRA|nr:unnamed protein product [Phytophthora fragariaefolia]
MVQPKTRLGWHLLIVTLHLSHEPRNSTDTSVGSPSRCIPSTRRGGLDVRKHVIAPSFDALRMMRGLEQLVFCEKYMKAPSGGLEGEAAWAVRSSRFEHSEYFENSESAKLQTTTTGT